LVLLQSASEYLPGVIRNLNYYEIPFVLVGNSFGRAFGLDAKVKQDKLIYGSLLNGMHLPHQTYCEVSTESGHNCEEPFLWVARHLTGNYNLRFYKAPTRVPPAAAADYDGNEEVLKNMFGYR
jgi:hypothetical protein